MASKIAGINHVLLICKDMNRTVDFFVNILGLSVKGTARQTMNVYPGQEVAASGAQVQRLYFLQTADKAMIVCAEVPDVDPIEFQPVLPNYWPGEFRNGQYGKVDHLALNVETRDDLAYFQQRLKDYGIAVSDIHERMSSPKFVKSIYFHSPDGLPLEICTWDFADPTWETASMENYMRDPEPVPTLEAGAGIS